MQHWKGEGGSILQQSQCNKTISKVTVIGQRSLHGAHGGGGVSRVNCMVTAPKHGKMKLEECGSGGFWLSAVLPGYGRLATCKVFT